MDKNVAPRMLVYQQIAQARLNRRPLLALLLDPDKSEQPPKIAAQAADLGVSVVLVGGSSVQADMCCYVSALRCATSLPIVLFPGDWAQFTPYADALLMPVLVSGRNPEYLIGQHVRAATAIKASGMEVMPTGYMLIDGGKITTVQRVSQTTPIASNDVELAVSTALAGELLGLRLIYLEAGSGALTPVPAPMISAVRSAVGLPRIVGGGIRTVEQLDAALNAGADMVVLGTSIEANPDFLHQAASLFR